MRWSRTYANRKWADPPESAASALALWLVWVLSGTPALTYEMLLRETAPGKSGGGDDGPL